jgi:hypothetical protein
MMHAAWCLGSDELMMFYLFSLNWTCLLPLCIEPFPFSSAGEVSGFPQIVSPSRRQHLSSSLDHWLSISLAIAFSGCLYLSTLLALIFRGSQPFHVSLSVQLIFYISYGMKIAVIFFLNFRYIFWLLYFYMLQHFYLYVFLFSEVFFLIYHLSF